MKFLTAILLSLCVSIIANSQDKNGYAFVGGSALIAKDFDNKGLLSAGIGFNLGDYLSAGPAFDLFIFKDPKFVLAKADFKVYPLRNDREVAPFVALQPGYVMYNQNNTKGTAAIDLMGGVMARPVKKKGIGIMLSAGYSKFGFKNKLSTTYHDGVKIQAGVAF